MHLGCKSYEQILVSVVPGLHWRLAPGAPMRFTALIRPLERLRGQPLAWLLAAAVVAPVIVVLAAAGYFWSTAGRLAGYRAVEPSRLYAAPLVLRVGEPVDRAGLTADLESLGY